MDRQEEKKMRRTILILAMIMTVSGFVFGQSKAEQEIRQTLCNDERCLPRWQEESRANEELYTRGSETGCHSTRLHTQASEPNVWM